MITPFGKAYVKLIYYNLFRLFIQVVFHNTVHFVKQGNMLIYINIVYAFFAALGYAVHRARIQYCAEHGALLMLIRQHVSVQIHRCYRGYSPAPPIGYAGSKRYVSSLRGGNILAVVNHAARNVKQFTCAKFVSAVSYGNGLCLWILH